MVERLVRDQEAAGSNPVTPIFGERVKHRFWVLSWLGWPRAGWQRRIARSAGKSCWPRRTCPMGHSINGFIVRPPGPDLAELPDRQSSVCRLPQSLCFIPVAQETIDPDEADSGIPEFHALCERLRVWAVGASFKNRIAYIETDYCGGIGLQGAVVWENGQAILGPILTDDTRPEYWKPIAKNAINQALRLLGAVKGSEVDEFDAVGLGQHRSNEDWIAASKS